jgi:hypothetical protein
MTDTASGSGRLRCSWEVWGGLIPGDPIATYTRRWFIDSETYYRETGMETYLKYRDEALEYAKSLMNPTGLNWVRVEWIYL